MNKKPLTKTEELFLKICENEFNKLRKDENLIFESLNFSFDWEKEYNKFKNSQKYFEVLNENSGYEKMKKIQNYFYENIIFPIVEGMYLKAEDLPITSEILLENTYHTIQDKILKKKVNKEILKKLEEAFLALDEENQIKVLEELGYDDIVQKISNGTSATFKFARKIANDLAMILQGFYYIFETIMYLPLDIPYFEDFLNNLFIISDRYKPIIKKELSILNMERPELRDFFETELNTDIKTILKDCWQRNIKVIDVTSPKFMESHPEVYKFYITVKTFFYRNMFKPFDLNANVKKKAFLSEIKNDYQLNKMISDYRLCVFDNIIDFLQSYAQIAFEIGDVENRLVKRLDQVKTQKNSMLILKTYKEFFNLKPKNNAEKVFILTVSNLIYIKEMFIRLKNDINDVAFYDRYIKKDLEILIKKVDQAIQNIVDAAGNKNRPPQKQYEETLKDNKEKKLVGNEPTEPKKISVFDL